MGRNWLSSFDHFGLLAPIYDRVMRTPDPQRLRQLADLRPTDRLLDVGGGTGRVATQLRASVDETWVLDVSRGMLIEAGEKHALIPCQGAVEALPFASDSFDKIVAVDTFHHFRDQVAGVEELLRVLAPGGRLVVEEPDIEHFWVKLIALGERVLLMRSHFHRAVDLRAMFSRGDTEVAVVKVSPNYWVVVRKAPDAPPDDGAVP